MTAAITHTMRSIDTLNACPLCGAGALRTLTGPGHWIGDDAFVDLAGQIGLARCRACSLVFTNPRPSQDRLNAYYAGNTYVCHDTAGSASAGAKANYVLDRIEQFLPGAAPRDVLDYGAGGGGFMLHARARGWRVQGFEPGRRGLESCRGLGLNVTANAEELRSGAFGLVTLHHVLEHLDQPAQILGDIKRLLAPQGRLFIEVPNANSLRARMALPVLSQRFGADERFRAFPIHLMYYSAATLRQLLESAGWNVEAMFTIGLGIDEFFARPDRPSNPPSGQPDRPDAAATARPSSLLGKPFRHRLRDVFLRTGLGENLVAIARLQ